MKKFTKLVFCELPETPHEFNIEKFKIEDAEQIKLYKDSKKPRRKKLLTYAQVTDKDRIVNYARVVPKGCCFLDYDDEKVAGEMYDIIIRSKLRCLILETVKGYHFLFRKPNFYKKEMTGATNWFGYKFDTKATTDTAEAVQIIKVCGMNRREVYSWDLDTPITLEKLDIEELDILPYWLWGKFSDKDLHKGGKPGESHYTLKDTPFTQLMKMKEGGRHNHIVERCSYFALSNGFEIDEFKSLITAIHDQYLVKLGTPMPDSDLFGDLEDRWAGYEAMLSSESWDYDEKERKWKKTKSKKEEKIDERRAAEYLFSQYDFYTRKQKADGTYTELVYREKDGDYEYKTDLPTIRHALKLYSDQNFKKAFFIEVEEQLMQMCAENKKLIKRSHQYVLVKNKVLSCITPTAYDFSLLSKKSPTDVVFRWTWQSEQWIEEHKEDLGGFITKFIKDLSRDASGKPQPEVEQWLYIIAGACMIPANQLQKIVILAGGGQNGKSLYTCLIRLCLGESMFNTSKIFDSNPQTDFWGAGLDKGICCIVDDLPEHYNKDAFSYIKGAITGTDSVEINEKFKPKKRLEVLPQIIACTNHDFKLYDKTEGMKRRVLILPTEYHIDDSLKDRDLQYKLVLNTSDLAKINEYKIADNFENEDHGELCMNMYTKEKGVLESLNGGSLAWFANKCRYNYFAWLAKKIVPGESEKMKKLCGDTFKNKLEIQCENFIKWYVDSKCGTDSSRNLSKANIHFKNFYPIYESYCEAEGEEKMKLGQFNKFCSKAITNLGYQITDKRDEKGQPYRYVVFGEEVAPSKK